MALVFSERGQPYFGSILPKSVSTPPELSLAERIIKSADGGAAETARYRERAAAVYLGNLTLRENELSKDKHGGQYLAGDIPFGD